MIDLIVGLVVDIIWFAVWLFVYFVPSIVGRNKKNSAAILVLNFLLGWTIFGWIGALIWALCEE